MQQDPFKYCAQADQRPYNAPGKVLKSEDLLYSDIIRFDLIESYRATKGTDYGHYRHFLYCSDFCKEFEIKIDTLDNPGWSLVKQMKLHFLRYLTQNYGFFAKIVGKIRQRSK
jgi:hypothetical protein